MANSMKFGPEWLRFLSGNAGNSELPKYELADYRYGREEMLALFDKNAVAPESLSKIGVLFVANMQLPLALMPMSDEEIYIWNTNINSDVKNPKSLTQLAPPGMNNVTGAIGRPVSNNRGGRGRSSYSSSRNYEDGQDSAGTSFGRTRYDRTQSLSSGERPGWPERNGGNNEQGDWNRNYQENDQRKDFSSGASFYSQASQGDVNWRRRPWNGNNEEGRKPRYNEQQQGRANTARNWRDGGSERDRDKEQSDISSEGAVKDRRWTSRVPATHTRRQNPGRKDENLPEWVHGNPDLEGTFDSTGAFQGSSNSTDNIDKQDVMKDEPPKKGMVVPSENLDTKKGKYKAGKDNSDDRSSSKNSREEFEARLEDLNSRPRFKFPRAGSNLKSDGEKKPTSTTTITTNDHTDKESKTDGFRTESNISGTSKSAAAELLCYEDSDEELANINAIQSKRLINPPKKTPSPDATSQGASDHRLVNSITSETVGKPHRYDEHSGMVMDMLSKIIDDEEKPNAVKQLIEDLNKWCYCDPQGKVQGPFTSSDMERWYSRGFFEGRMLVKRICETHFYALNDLIRLNSTSPFGDISLTTLEQIKSPSNVPQNTESTLSVGQDPHLLQQQQLKLLQMQYQYLKLTQQQQQQHNQENTPPDNMRYFHHGEPASIPPAFNTAAIKPNVPLQQNFVPPPPIPQSPIAAPNPLLAATVNPLLAPTANNPDIAAVLTHLQQQYYQQIQELQLQQQIQLQRSMESNRMPIPTAVQQMSFYQQRPNLESAQNILRSMNMPGTSGHNSVAQAAEHMRVQQQQQPQTVTSFIQNLATTSQPTQNNMPISFGNNPVVTSAAMDFISNPMMQPALNPFNNLQPQNVQPVMPVVNSITAQNPTFINNNNLSNVVPSPIIPNNLVGGYSGETESLWRNERNKSGLPYENQQRPLYLSATSSDINADGLWTGDAVPNVTSIQTGQKTLDDSEQEDQDPIQEELKRIERIMSDRSNIEKAARRNRQVEVAKDEEKVVTTKKQRKETGEKPKKLGEESSVKPTANEKPQKANKAAVENKKAKPLEEKKAKATTSDRPTINNKQTAEEKKVKPKEDKKSKEEEKRKKSEEEKRKKDEQHKKEQEMRRREEEERKKEEKERRRKIEEEKREARELAKKELLMKKEAEEEALRLEQQKKQEEALNRLRNQQLMAAANSGSKLSQQNPDEKKLPPREKKSVREETKSKSHEKQSVSEEKKSTPPPQQSETKVDNTQQKKRQKNNKNEAASASTAWAETKKVQPKSLTEIQVEEQKEQIKKKELEKVERQRRLEKETKAAAEATKLNELTAKKAPWSVPVTVDQYYLSDPFMLSPSTSRDESQWNPFEQSNSTSQKNASQQQQQKKASQAQKNSSQQHKNTGKKVNGGRKEKESATSIRVRNDELFDWGVKTLSRFDQPIPFDVPTCIGFLRELGSVAEITDYVHDFIGASKESNDFVSQFVQRRTRIDGPLDNSEASGFPKINAKIKKKTVAASSASKKPKNQPGPSGLQKQQHQQQAQKTNNNKKKQGLKIDHTILGFSVTASTNRVNAGEIDYGDANK